MPLRKVALLAAILLGLVRVHWVVEQIRLLDKAQPNVPWIYMVQLAGNILLLLPLPFLLAVLYRSGATLTVPTKLRYSALTTALVLGIYTGRGFYHSSVYLVRDWNDAQSFGELTVADAMWTWLSTEKTQQHLWSWTDHVAQIAFALVLFSLFLQRGPAPQARPSALLMKTALLATIAGGVTVLLNIGFGVHAGSRFAIASIPQLCWTIGAIIIFKSQPRDVETQRP
jgi:hypothetical protein